MDEWRPIPGFEGFYWARSDGSIRNARHHILKFYRCGRRRNYAGMNLKINRRVIPTGVHRLVAAAFLGPCPASKEVNHIDGNPLNNRLENLEYVTRSENHLHKHRVLGWKSKSAVGSAHPMSKLTEPEATEIRREFALGATKASLSRKYGVRPWVIFLIVKRRTWKHVP